MVATPGHIIDMLEKMKINFNSCQYFCMDKANRMVDLGFEGDVQNIMSFFKVTNSAPVVDGNSDVSFTVPKVNAAFLHHNALEDPRFFTAISYPSHTCQHRLGRCCQPQHPAGCRICQTGGKDGLFA